MTPESPRELVFANERRFCAPAAETARFDEGGDEVRAQGCPEPVFEVDEFFTAIFRPNPEVRIRAAGRVTSGVGSTTSASSRPQVEGEAPPQVTPQVAPEVTPEVRRGETQ